MKTYTVENENTGKVHARGLTMAEAARMVRCELPGLRADFAESQTAYVNGCIVTEHDDSDGRAAR